MENKLLKIDDVSKFLNLSKSSLYAFAKTDSIPHFKLGGKLLFSETDIKNWLETKKHG
jgi:excisionase family DNA binding protein